MILFVVGHGSNPKIKSFQLLLFHSVLNKIVGCWYEFPKANVHVFLFFIEKAGAFYHSFGCVCEILNHRRTLDGNDNRSHRQKKHKLECSAISTMREGNKEKKKLRRKWFGSLKSEPHYKILKKISFKMRVQLCLFSI